MSLWILIWFGSFVGLIGLCQGMDSWVCREEVEGGDVRMEYGGEFGSSWSG
jgi:hypothetical protein